MDPIEKIILKKRGELIYKFRLNNNIGQSELAKKIGVSQPIVSNAERGLFKKTQDKVILLIKEQFEVESDFFDFEPSKEGLEKNIAPVISDFEKVLKKEMKNKNAVEVASLLKESILAMQEDVVKSLKEDARQILREEVDKAKSQSRNPLQRQVFLKCIEKVDELKIYLEETSKRNLDKKVISDTLDELKVVLKDLE